MTRTVQLGDAVVGDGHPCYVIAEIGINHNGDLDTAKRLIDTAQTARCDAVKFQKRTPRVCVPRDVWDKVRDTPWGEMTYIEYKERVEFGEKEFAAIDGHCADRDIAWTVSVWDEPSVDFIEAFDVPWIKIPSASLTDHALLERTRKTGKPMVISTGMSTMEQIEEAVDVLGGEDDLVIMHCTSTYPAAAKELNLRAIQTLKETYDCPIGYSGHETGLQTTLAAATLGADAVERHITLDRAMWGSDHAASVEPWGLMRLVRDIRVIEEALGDGKKRVYDSELPIIEKLRRVQ